MMNLAAVIAPVIVPCIGGGVLMAYLSIKQILMETNKKWRSNGPCQNYKCEFYRPTNPDPENNCAFKYLQENCIDYQG